jgi:hypothetical protein
VKAARFSLYNQLGKGEECQVRISLPSGFGVNYSFGEEPLQIPGISPPGQVHATRFFDVPVTGYVNRLLLAANMCRADCGEGSES